MLQKTGLLSGCYHLLGCDNMTPYSPDDEECGFLQNVDKFLLKCKVSHSR